MAYQQPHMFCKFCHNRDPRDPVKYTHWVRNMETNETMCPFLKATVCPICLDFGHTRGVCENKGRLSWLKMKSELPRIYSYSVAEVNADTTDAVFKKLEKIWEEDDEFLKNKLDYEFEQERRAYMQNPKFFCDYCVNRFPWEQNTHNTSVCPRLACYKCRKCGGHGHTERFCKANDPNQDMSLDPAWEIDVDCS